MTDWTDAEISRRLALAIGWSQQDIDVLDDKPRDDIVCCRTDYFGVPSWRAFDYRDPAVIWPICVRFNKWPWQEWRYGGYTGRWFVALPDGPCTGVVDADTAAKAVALAVIKAKEQT